MDKKRSIEVVRLHLLDMSKLSHRAVDYAIKGYKLGSPEFCRYVRLGERQLRELRRKITDLCMKLLMEDLGGDPEALISELNTEPPVRFPVSALRICSALHATYTAATEIAHNTMLLLDEARIPGSVALEKLCLLVNRQMCLCIVSLFKKQTLHADAVLQNNTAKRLLDEAFHALRNDINHQVAATAALDMAIARALSQIARQTTEIAEAIVFWLDGRECALRVTAGAH